MRCKLPYSWVSHILALLLLVAAGLKLNGLAVDPVGRMGLFSMPVFQIAIVEFEIFLAAWLLWGRQPLGSWATALGAFSIFAAVSAYQGWIGRASCGCFGRLSVSPWSAFGIDLAVLLALVVGRPDLAAVRQHPRRILTNILPAAYGLSGAAVVLGVLAALASLLFGSPDAALAHLRGERISLYPRLVDVGTGAAVCYCRWTIVYPTNVCNCWIKPQ
ncbi:MAG TPA: MauE/DoxX family redox-associated membrane protein [Gemmataceae bacterium]